MTPESAIPFEKLPATPELARDYIASFDRVSGLFRGPYSDISNHLDEARALSTRSYPRKELAIRLVERNAVLGADPEALASAEALLDPRTFVVITGQQTGIYTGPLYTIYKAITAISLARRLDEATDEFRFVPMFWCASEDHDLDEINHLFLPDGDVVRKHIAPFATDGRPAGGVTVDADLLDFHDTIRQTLGETIFRDPLIAELAPRNGESIATWFERSLLRLLAGTGMIVVDPEWIRDLAAPVFRGAIEHRAEIEDRVESARDTIRSLGYDPVLDATDDLHLFRTVEGKRARVPAGSEADRQSTLDALRADPTGFSADVVTRPLVQSHALPVTTFVGGPSEVAYFAEVSGAFEALDIPMPRVVPRTTGTLITPKMARALEAFGIEPTAIPQLEDRKPAAQALPEGLDTALRDLAAGTSDPLRRVLDEVRSVDPNAVRALEKLRDQIEQRVGKIDRNARDAVERRAGVDRDRFARLLVEALPRGRLQERVYGAVHFLARHGTDWIAPLLERIDPFRYDHWLLPLETLRKQETSP